MLREFNHVNPQDDEEGKVFADTRVSFCFKFFVSLKLFSLNFATWINLFGIDYLFNLNV